MKRVLTLAALAAIGLAGAAYAGNATAPKPMSDSEMDKVTAGSPGLGHTTAVQAGGQPAIIPFPRGLGRCTAVIHGGNVSATCGG